jgi:RNA polymerase sigma factor (sigma-70 family)
MNSERENITHSEADKPAEKWFVTWPTETRQEFIENYFAFFRRLAKRFGLKEPDASDAAQDAFIRIADIADRYDPQKPLWPWASWVARHVVVERLRRRNDRAHRFQSLDHDTAGGRDEFEKIWQEELTSQLMLRVTQLLRESKLSDNNQAIAMAAIAADITGDSAQDIATRFEVNVNQVYVLKNRLRRRLQALQNEVLRLPKSNKRDSVREAETQRD